MVLMKSFFRKKTTKIYIIIFIILAFSLIICYSLKKYYVTFANTNYKGSFIFVKGDTKNLKNIENIKNVNEIYESVVINMNGIEALFTVSEFINTSQVLSNEDILIPNTFKDDYPLNSQFTILKKNQNINLNVKGHFDSYNFPFVYIINHDLVDWLVKNDIGETAYAFTLKNWLEREDTYKEITKAVDSEYISIHLTNNHKINFDYLVKVFNILIKVIIFVFVIIIFVALLNIWNDERKNHILYKSMGYTKLQLFILAITKISVILFITIIAFGLGITICNILF